MPVNIKHIKNYRAAWLLSIVILGALHSACNPDMINPTETGLVSYYNFDGNADDVFGNNHGIGINALYDFDPPGGTNRVLELSGLDSYVVLPDSFDYEARTINLWFKLLDPSDDFVMIYSSDNPNLDFGLVAISTQMIGSHINLYFNFSNKPDTVTINSNTWYNAAIATNGKCYCYYLNGNPVSSGCCPSYACSSYGNNTAVLGTDRTLERRFFNGRIDDLRIYERKLSEKEIKEIYESKF